MMTTTDRIDVRDLPDHLKSTNSLAAEARFATREGPEVSPLSQLDEQERRLIVEALNRATGNQSEAARILRIGRDALRYKTKKLGIEFSPVEQ